MEVAPPVLQRADLTDELPVRSSWLPCRGWAGAAVAALVLVIAVAYLWLASYGTWSFRGHEVKGVAFDSLGRHLLSGDAGVNDDAIGFEGLKVGSRTVMYWGPFPALLRIVPNLIFPGMYGEWSRSSCWLAALLSLLAAVGVAREALTGGERALDCRRCLLLASATIGFGLGTPVVYLLSCSRIYHESILWGLCGSLWGTLFTIKLLRRDGKGWRALFGLACSFAVALLSRLTFAVPLAAALAALVGQSARAAVTAPRSAPPRGRALMRLVLALTPALAAVGFQLWYNFNRFGTIWENTRINSYINTKEIGGVFNAARLPSAAANYFGLTARSLSPNPPFFQLARVRYRDDALFFGWKEETLSLTLGSSWLVLGAVLGVYSLVRRPRPMSVAVAAFFAAEALIISAYYMETQRFAAEYVPLFVYLLALWFGRVRDGSVSRRWVIWTFMGLALLSSAATVGSALQWNQAVNVDVSREYKVLLARLLYRRAQPPATGGSRICLSNLQPTEQHASRIPLRIDTTWDELPIVLRNEFYPRGLAMHAVGSATYAVPAGTRAFSAIIGIPDSSMRCPNGSVVFELRDQNGRQLYRSGIIRTGDDPQSVLVPMSGVKRLTLGVGDAGDGSDCDQAVWAAPYFILAPKAPAAPEGNS